ncbi:RNA polymerase sigma factor [Protaetiibacter intestinalis]|uniref:Sigma-70 family RNA polymerase sigma factor n=1 Tax=Protaetiibacter intestinalis TaxID=2419774 RepID=A0A387B6Z0_9MICO|nr:sigma-70 family RNA polymerase sigma factor [Protaetiibacter intestinalis]AYF98113.1 sigma-70 family RNA polymerase sigma factor [Protaetiibacter intestinalis]
MSDGDTVRNPGPPDHGEADPLWARAGELFEEWRSGRAGRIDGLVRLVSPVLWHVVRAYGLGREEAEDVIQTTWLALVRSRDGIHDPRTVVAWLTTTARRESWRVVKADSRVDPVDDEVLERAGGSSPAAEATAEQHLDDARLWRAVDSLSERCRRLLRVIAFSARPDYVHLAAELQMPVGSIGPTRGRCLDKLRGLLDEKEVG